MGFLEVAGQWLNVANVSHIRKAPSAIYVVMNQGAEIMVVVEAGREAEAAKALADQLYYMSDVQHFDVGEYLP